MSRIDLAHHDRETHVRNIMQTLSNNELVGYVQLRVGSIKVDVPIRAARQSGFFGSVEPLARFETDGNAFAILVRGDVSSKPVERAMQDAVAEAVRHFSRKLLN